MENNLTASEQLALLQPTAAGPTPQETVASRALSFVPPSVSGARAELNQIQNLIRDQESRRVNEAIAARPDVSPFQPGLSPSQVFSKQRAMIADAYNKAGVPLTATDLSNMQGQLDGTLKPIDNTFLYEKRVADAYKSIGREGDAVDKAGADYWLNKLKLGEISPANFDKEFLGIAANYTGPDAGSLLDPINKARTQLGMDSLTAAQLAANQAAAQSPGSTQGVTRDQVLAAYAANPKAELNPNEEAINYWMKQGLGSFDATVDSVRAADPALANSIDAARNTEQELRDVFKQPTTPSTTQQSNNPFQQYINPSVPTNPFQQYINPSVPTNPYQQYITTPVPPIPPLNPTREQVLAAYAANPKAVLNPDEEAINFFMQPGKLANFNTIVDEVRAADPALAARIDAERGTLTEEDELRAIFKPSPRLFRNGGPVKN